MKKIKDTYNTIDTIVNKNNRNSLIISCTSILAVVIMGVFTYKMSQQDLLAVDKDGDIVSLSRTSANEEFRIEADNHVRLFYDRFFSYDKTNYKDKVELGLHLGGNSVKRLYETYNSKNWYASVVNNDMVIESKVIGKIQFEKIDNGYRFYSKGEQIIKRGELTQRRQLDIKGVVEKSSQGRIEFINPHGMKIENLVITNNNIILENE